MRIALVSAAFFKRDLLTDLSYRLTFGLHALNILFGVASYFFLARFVDRGALAGVEPFPFLLVGLAVNAYMSTWLVCFTDAIRSGQTTGTLKLMLASPITERQFLGFSGLYPALRAAIEAAVYLLGGWALGASFADASLPGAAVMALLSSLAFATIGIGSAAMALLVKRGDPLLWLVTSLSWLAGGVLYPIELLPAPLEQLARVLPVTHAVIGTRAALLGGGPIVEAAAPLALFVVVALPLSLAAFRVAVRRARRMGSLSHV
jgi:ABC-2 type transport system permease protein